MTSNVSTNLQEQFSSSIRPNLRGVLLPFTTPFSSDGSLDLRALQSNIRDWNTKGITGYVALGSTGERAHLDAGEYLQVVEASRSEVPRDLLFIAGVAQNSTLKTISEVRIAASSGADAVLVLTPHYYRPSMTQQVLVDHYRAVADASPVPVILYSMPALTGVKIAPDTVGTLSQHENIIGIKDSSNDLGEFRSTVKLCSPEFAVITGNGTVLYDALLAGARAAILAVGCVVPEMCVEILNATNDKRLEHAADLQQKLTPLAAAVTTKYGIGGLKAALDMNGYVGGAVRAPLRMPDQRAREEIAQLLNEAQHSTVHGTRLSGTDFSL